jgi:hypothetical protein
MEPLSKILDNETTKNPLIDNGKWAKNQNLLKKEIEIMAGSILIISDFSFVQYCIHYITGPRMFQSRDSLIEIFDYELSIIPSIENEKAKHQNLSHAKKWRQEESVFALDLTLHNSALPFSPKCPSTPQISNVDGISTVNSQFDSPKSQKLLPEQEAPEYRKEEEPQGQSLNASCTTQTQGATEASVRKNTPIKIIRDTWISRDNILLKQNLTELEKKWVELLLEFLHNEVRSTKSKRHTIYGQRRIFNYLNLILYPPSKIQRNRPNCNQELKKIMKNEWVQNLIHKANSREKENKTLNQITGAEHIYGNFDSEDLFFLHQTSEETQFLGIIIRKAIMQTLKKGPLPEKIDSDTLQKYSKKYKSKLAEFQRELEN